MKPLFQVWQYITFPEEHEEGIRCNYRILKIEGKYYYYEVYQNGVYLKNWHFNISKFEEGGVILTKLERALL